MTPLLRKIKRRLGIYYYGVKKRRKTNQSFKIDLQRLLRFFLAFQKIDNNKDSLRCKIMLLNHQLEKAQTYKKAKEGYGKEKIRELIASLIYYNKQFGRDDIFSVSIGVIESHLNNPHSYKDENIIKSIEELLSLKNINEGGGTILYDSKVIPKINNFDAFLNSRRSCRRYSKEDITEQEIKTAVKLAQTAPSACNRQPVRIHVYKDKEVIKNLILSQRADVEWCLDATALIVITTNQYYYRDYLERTQYMFDAGLFSMNLNLILHNMGIGSCFKMAQNDPDIEKETKEIGNIPDFENICVLYCIGKYPKDPFVVAKSQRIELDNVLKIH